MKHPALPRWLKNLLFLVGAFAVWKLFVYAVALAASRIIYGLDLYWSLDYSRKFPYLTWIWTNFDGTQYVLIAQNGYTGGQQPYFPLYPWIVRYLFYPLAHLSFVTRALIVSNAAFFLALIILWKLLALDGYKRMRSTFIALLLIFPTSFFYGATYNDSLFFLLATLTLYLARKKHWMFACAFGGLASLTRLNGLALFFFIAAEIIETKEHWKNMVALILVPLGFIAELVNVQIAFGNWRQLFIQIGNWRSRGIVNPLRVIWRYIKILVVNSPRDLTYWVAGIELFFVCVFLFLLIFSWKKIRFSYWLFFAVSILIPAVTGTFQGMPRYGLHLYPFFLALLLVFERLPRWGKLVYVSISLWGLAVFVSMFTRGYFIA